MGNKLNENKDKVALAAIVLVFLLFVYPELYILHLILAVIVLIMIVK